MSVAAWVVSVLVGLVLYGGLGWCIAIAVRRERTKAGGEQRE